MLKAWFVSNNKGKRSPFQTKKMKRCSFGTYSFLTHGHFVSLRNFFLVSNKAMKTLTTQKSIIWSERPYDRP